MSEAPYMTRGGRALSDQDIEALAGEAERGYDPGSFGMSLTPEDLTRLRSRVAEDRVPRRRPGSHAGASPPSSGGVLSALAQAGTAGMMAGDLARTFGMRASYQGSPQRRLSEVNTILEKQEARGNVRRADEMEPSLRYHNVPGWRWFIVEDAIQRRGDRQRLREERRAGDAARRDARLQRARARQSAADRFRAVCSRSLAERDELVRAIRGEGELSLGDIGRAAGITRQRVHQIMGEG